MKMSNYLVKSFQKEACTMALELLRDVYRLPLHRLYFTYFGGDQNLGLSADEECRNVWLGLGLVCCENLATSNITKTCPCNKQRFLSVRNWKILAEIFLYF